MVVQEETQDRVRDLLREALPMLCKSGLAFASEFSVDALIGITLNKGDVFLVSIKETIKPDILEGKGEENNGDGLKAIPQENISPSQRHKPHRKRRRSKSAVSKHSDGESSSPSNDESEDATAIKRERREVIPEATAIYNHSSVQDNSDQATSNSQMNYASLNMNSEKSDPKYDEDESNDAIIVKEEPADFSSISFSDMSASEQAFTMSAFSNHGAPHPMAAAPPHIGGAQPSSISSPMGLSLSTAGPSYPGQLPVQMVRNMNAVVHNVATSGQAGPGAEAQVAGAPGALASTSSDNYSNKDAMQDLEYLRANADTICMYKEDGGQWVCRYCCKSSKWKHSIKLHVLGVHLQTKKFTCSCGRAFKWYQDMKSHRKQCAEHQQKQQQEKQT